VCLVVTTLAVIIYRDTPEHDEERLSRILTFFGVPWQSLRLTELVNTSLPSREEGSYAVFGPAQAIWTALGIPDVAAVLRRAVAVYAYITCNVDASARALSEITGRPWALEAASEGPASIEVTDQFTDLTGPMSGLKVKAHQTAVTLTPVALSAVRVESSLPHERTIVPIVLLNGRAAFASVGCDAVRLYISATAPIVDIDQPVHRNYYDIKDDFLQTVPLVMFIIWVFRRTMWRPREIGACLIIDDPLLKQHYGFCDFTRLRDAMRQHGFTTNIAFIPWNWRRTTKTDSDFFRREADMFSVSIHGCDHVAAEFGRTSAEYVSNAATLAQARMNKHEHRTQIRHERVMVFPQGVFSSICPDILKRHGFVAAINTEISPVDSAGGKTLVRDVWDIAILRYGSFPIYTRRYEHHGLENFAFDLLVGKPCFIVAHHGFFRDRGAKLLQLVANLSRLNPDLRWRSPAEVIRRSYRWRNADGRDEYEMYGTELIVPQLSGANRARVRKKETDFDSVAEVLCDDRAISWKGDLGFLTFEPELSGACETLVSLRYKRGTVVRRRNRSLRSKIAVAARRFLSEMRDEVVPKVSPRRTMPS
jgi:hypothetical protein